MSSRLAERNGHRVSGSTWIVRSIGLSVEAVDHRRDVHEFLASRSARLTPEQVGLPTYGDKRVLFFPLEQGDTRP